MRQHMASTNTVDFVPPAEEITADYNEGTTERVTMHDGSYLNLHKLEAEHDIHSRRSALKLMKDYAAEDKVLTGVLFIDENTQELHEIMNTTKTPLRNLTEKELCPGSEALEKINDRYR
jgi:2-oxoglutarate ferredoxin oxidoreductase subunit beta